jgi:hypothetical protein
LFFACEATLWYHYIQFPVFFQILLRFFREQSPRISLLAWPTIVMLPMLDFDLFQESQLVQEKKASTYAKRGPFNHGGDLGGDAPCAVLLRVHANESRHQAGQRVRHARQKQLVHKPDVVFSVPESEEHHAERGYAAHYRGYDQQWDVLFTMSLAACALIV